MLVDIILLLVLLFLSALYAGSEIVFVVANRLKLEVQAKRKFLFPEQSLTLINSPEKYFTISLVGNNVVNVTYSSIAALLLTNYFSLDYITILIITASSILVFGEIFPKYFFRENANAYVSFFTIFLYISRIILFPFIYITTKILKIFASIVKISLEPEKYSYSKDDIFSLIKESEQAGSFEDDSAAYLKKTIRLNDIHVHQVMIPRTEIASVQKYSSYEQVCQKFYETKYSRLIVYEGTIDNIIGLISIKDLFRKIENIESIIKDVIYVPESKSCTELLQQFFATDQSIAIVIDEFGGTAGIATVEDIIEEIVGEIDEPDEVEHLLQQKIDDNTFLFNGRLEIDTINENYDLHIPPGNYITLSGYVCEKIGRVPKTNEVIEVDNYVVTIIKATRTKIDKLKLKINPDNEKS